ncbi:MAG: ribonuclease III [Gallionella sp.]|nr:ribonuclease III [Gallionella sp.]MDD4947651.1 ribonuclease III [Gallionella sp.]MDD5612167.1 ribonuclease III [Gallionella sp.]
MRLTKGHDHLCQQLGYVFTDPQLLQRALTHRSYSADHYERLEFLGDSILGCAIAKYLFNAYPDLSEGELSRLRSNLVKEATLVIFAQQLHLGRLMLLGEGEMKSGGSRRPSILADAVEALIGAICLDGGYPAAEQVVLKLFIPYLDQADVRTFGKDAKTLLQEYLQAQRLVLPNYTVTDTQGEAHAQLFRVECVIAPLGITTRGEGTSRRNAEQQAAQAAYQLICQKTGNEK